MKGIIAGIVAGIAGTIIWAVIVATTGYEIGWIAWGIGAAVGAGVAWGTEGSPATGILAVIISVAAIVAGKYVSVEMMMSKEMDIANQEIEKMVQNDEYLISQIADEIVTKYEENGQTVSWPENVDADEDNYKAFYPTKIWSQADKKWSSMSEEEKDDYRYEVKQNISNTVNEIASAFKEEGFVASFGFMDIIFFILAISTAYKIGAQEG